MCGAVITFFMIVECGDFNFGTRDCFQFWGLFKKNIEHKSGKPSVLLGQINLKLPV